MTPFQDDVNKALKAIRERADATKAAMAKEQRAVQAAAEAEALRILATLPDAVEAAIRDGKDFVTVMELTGPNAPTKNATCLQGDGTQLSPADFQSVASVIYDAVRAYEDGNLLLYVTHGTPPVLHLKFK